MVVNELSVEPKTKADQEKMAYSCMGLGYVYVCAGGFENASILYKKSLQVSWARG